MTWKRLWLFMVLISFVVASPCFARKGSSKTATEIKTVVEQHDKALSSKSLKGVMETFASSRHITLMGTGPGEIYVGREGIEGAYTEFFTKFETGSLHFNYDWVNVGHDRNVGWFAVTSYGKGKVKGQEKEFAFNLSGTMEKHHGKWRIVLLHFSRLGAGEQPPAKEPK